MSSGVEGDGIIAAAVIVPAAAAYGAGWLAWQAGKLLIEANRAADRQIAEKKRQLAEAARHRKMAAISAHSQLVDMCHQILASLDAGSTTGSIISFAEIEQLRYDLRKICEESVPDDVAKIESLTSLGYLKLDSIVRKQHCLASIDLSSASSGLYQGLSVADLMDDLRVVIMAMKISATDGVDVKAADPVALERVKLNSRFAQVTSKIVYALEHIDELTRTCGLTTAGSAWFHSCFNGIDELIEVLCMPTTTNAELKKGILRLEESVEQYELMAPSIEKEIRRMLALYKVYVDASNALGEATVDISEFKKSSEIEEKLLALQSRAERAAECAEIYKKLGPAAYLCYAWDQELKAMGYEVHTRKKISEMAQKKPSHARLGEAKLPFYQWSQDDLTQLYSVSSKCALQVIVHDDGTVSMQTIAESVDDSIVPAQRAHCAQLKALYARLRKNWFVIYDYQETEAPEQITTVSTWRTTDGNAWHEQGSALVTDQRAKDKQKDRAKQYQ